MVRRALHTTLEPVAQRELNRVANAAQPAFFRPSKLDTASDFSVVHVKARNYAFTKH